MSATSLFSDAWLYRVKLYTLCQCVSRTYFTQTKMTCTQETDDGLWFSSSVDLSSLLVCTQETDDGLWFSSSAFSSTLSFPGRDVLCVEEKVDVELRRPHILWLLLSFSSTLSFPCSDVLCVEGKGDVELRQSAYMVATGSGYSTSIVPSSDCSLTPLLCLCGCCG